MNIIMKLSWTKKEGGLEETDIIAEFGDIDDIAAKLFRVS